MMSLSDVDLPALTVPPEWPRTRPDRPTRDARSLGALAGAIVGAIVALAVVFLSTRIIRHAGAAAQSTPQPGRPHVVVLVAMMIASTFVVLAIHEMGHAVGGALAGWQLRSLFIGPCRVLRDMDDGRLRAHWHSIYFLYGGAVLSGPTDREPPDAQRRHRLMYVAGGPLMSLALAAALFVALRAVGVTRHEVVTKLGPATVAFTAVASFAVGIGTLLPISQGGGAVNDGLQVLRLLRRDDDPAVERAMVTLAFYDRRPRDWSRDQLERARILAPPQRAMIEYYRALDDGLPARAHDILQRALDAAGASTGRGSGAERARLSHEAAIFEGLWRRDYAAASWWHSLGPAVCPDDPHVVHLSRAAVAYAAGDDNGVARALDTARRVARRKVLPHVEVMRAPVVERLANRDPMHRGLSSDDVVRRA